MVKHRSSQRYFEHGRLLEYIQSGTKNNADGDISDSADEVEVVVESQNTRPKKTKQSQITDVFRTDK